VKAYEEMSEEDVMDLHRKILFDSLGISLSHFSANEIWQKMEEIRLLTISLHDGVIEDNQNEINAWYDNASDLLAELNEVKRGSDDKRRLAQSFFRAKGLSEKQRIELEDSGFEPVNYNELNGKLSGSGFFIKKNYNKESNRHFILKYLFKELHKNMKVEYYCKGKYADVVYVSKDFKIAVEIETGTNNLKQIESKINWLNDNFEYWIIVCLREYKKFYVQFVDLEKSFSLTPKKAMQKLLELIGNDTTPSTHR